MGSATACTGLSGYELWYAHYDNTPSFADFKTFGGWAHPTFKQFAGTTSLCNAGVDKNYKA